MEQFSDATPKEESSEEFWSLRHGLHFTSCERFKFGFVFRLMTRDLVVFQVVPDFFVRIPIGRVTGQVEHMQAGLASDPSFRFLGCVRRGFVHHDDQMTTRMVSKHLLKELDHFS